MDPRSAIRGFFCVVTSSSRWCVGVADGHVGVLQGGDLGVVQVEGR
jgi:hypothetical protein